MNMTNSNSTNGRCPTLNRKSFMAELRSLLAFLDAAERERVLNRYERMFDEAGPDGEAAVIRCFGSPVRQVLQIEREYREATENGETPFADGEIAASPDEGEAAVEEMPEEIAGAEGSPDGPTEGFLTETAEITEQIETEPETAVSPTPVFSLLPELDLDGLDLPELGLALTEEPVETEPEPAAEIETAGEEPMGSEQSETEPQVDELIGEIVFSAEEAQPEEPIQEESTAEEAAASVEPDEIVFSAEPEEPETAEIPTEIEPLTDDGEEYYYEEVEARPAVSGGRAFGAVAVTVPMLLLWAVLFGLSLGLGLAVLAVGGALCMAGAYLTGYVFGSAIAYMPDLLLTAGAALAVFALSLLLLWAGVSIAVSGCTLTVRLTRSIYRSILYPKKGANYDE